MPTIAEAQAAALRSGFLETIGTDPASFENAALSTMEAMVGLYSKEVIEAAQNNLDAEKKQSTGNLQSSLTFRSLTQGQKLVIEFLGADYLKFVDQGVQGSDSAKSVNRTSPFRYKNKMPPAKIIEKWILQNNVKARAADVSRYGARGGERSIRGNVSNKTLSFLIARSIKQRGLKATGFWTKAWDATFKDFNQQMAKALGADIQITFQTMNKIVNGNNS